MFNTIIYQASRCQARGARAGFGPARSSVSASALVVVLLALLFAAAIVGALQPARLVDPLLAGVQGGL